MGNALEEMLKRALADDKDEQETGSISTDELVKLAARYLEPNEFRTGDMVVWKDGMKNKMRPAYGQPVVVVELINLRNTSEHYGSQHWGQPETIRCAFVDNDGEFLTFPCDGNRFKHYEW